jgi:dihydroorotate dehydrogenase electron transfer subunit
MKQTATIIENSELASGIRRLVLGDTGDGAVTALARAAAPGQFAGVYLNSDSMLLPRPFGISDVRAGGDCAATITFVYAIVGAGTAELAGYAPGTRLGLLGPQGNGYDLTAPARNTLLIGGGLGIPPLLFAARRLSESRAGGDATKVTALLGYRDTPFYADEFKRYCDEVYDIEGADGTVLDLVARLVAQGTLDLADAAVLACGPYPMLKAVAAWSLARGIPAQVSLEARMGCGYGACVGCTVETLPPAQAPPDEQDAAVPIHGQDATAPIHGHDAAAPIRRKVCTDGPVFPAEAILWR